MLAIWVRVCSSSAADDASARFQFAHALGVAALARGGALQFDGRGVGAVLRFLDFVLQLIAALGHASAGRLPWCRCRPPRC